mgnify:CR=1 FL=1
MTSKKRNTGRSTKYTELLADEICEVIAANGKGLQKLCIENPHWPNKDTIFSWIKNNQKFSDQYARAKKCQIEALVDEIIDIADDDSNDTIINEQGNRVLNKEYIARSRLRIDTRKWLASKLIPKVYGAVVDNSPEMDDTTRQELLALRAKLETEYEREY